MAALDARDLALLEKLVDEQIAPFRRLGWGLMALLPVGLTIALLEWRDARFAHPGAFFMPTTSWLAFGVGAAACGLGAWLWFNNRRAKAHVWYQTIVEHRAAVTRVEVIRVINSRFDRIIVHSPRSPKPVPLIVSNNDRDAVAALLARAYPQVAAYEPGRSVNMPC